MIAGEDSRIKLYITDFLLCIILANQAVQAFYIIKSYLKKNTNNIFTTPTVLINDTHWEKL